MAVVVAATEAGPSAAAAALMAAALLLPGLAAQAQVVADDTGGLQAALHRDSVRAPGGGIPSSPALSVEQLAWRGSAPLDGRHTLEVGAVQDTWSGATPVAIAPQVALGNRPVLRGAAGSLVTVGASPMITGRLLLDHADRPVERDAAGRIVDAPDLLHTLSSASPETRRQLDLKLQRRLDDGQMSLGIGVSQERDHQARFVSLARRLDLGASTWTLALSATRADIAAVLDHDAEPYFDKTPQADRLLRRNGQTVHQGRRDEAGATLAWTRVLGPGALLDSTLSLTESRGDLSNPYKAVSVIFAPPTAVEAGDTGDVRTGDLRALLERRPDQRRQWNAGTRLVLHHEASDGALHMGAGVFADSWGVRGVRLSGEWFQPLDGGALLSLRLSHHSQSAARFFTPYLVSHQAWRQLTVLPDGSITARNYDPALLPPHFSSDTRLGAFGSLSLELGYSRPLTDQVDLDLSALRGWQSGRLKWGGNGLGDWADRRYWTLQASLNWRFDALSPTATDHGDTSPGHATGTHGDPQLPVPAGVAGVHAAPGQGHWMLGLRLGAQRWSGPWRDGSTRLSDSQAAASGCAGAPCASLPDRMDMRMSMLELMVGLGRQASLMLMTQHMTHRMDVSLVPGAPPQDVPVHSGRHEHGGLGDSQLHLRWHGGHPGLAWVLGLGLQLPTGDAGATHRRSHQQDGAPMGAALQTGGGTWDLLPSAAVHGAAGPWGWGAQLSAASRLQSANAQGWARGLRWQADGWLGAALGAGWGATARLSWRVDHGVQGTAKGATTPLSPTDLTAQQGGRAAELGLGLSTALDAHGGARRGTLSVERVQPLSVLTRGVQLSPRNSWLLAWSHHL
jgi:hypothetical protein